MEAPNPGVSPHARSPGQVRPRLRMQGENVEFVETSFQQVLPRDNSSM